MKLVYLSSTEQVQGRAKEIKNGAKLGDALLHSFCASPSIHWKAGICGTFPPPSQAHKSQHVPHPFAAPPPPQRTHSVISLSGNLFE